MPLTVTPTLTSPAEAQREGEGVAEALLTLRLQARDQALAALATERAFVCRPTRGALDLIAECVDRALTTDRSLNRLF